MYEIYGILIFENGFVVLDAESGLARMSVLPTAQDTWSRFFKAERGLAVMQSWVVPRVRHEGDLVAPLRERRINQNDIDERNTQVSMMRDVYHMAQQVVVWAGEEGDDSHLIFEHVKDWKTYRDDYKAGRTIRNDPWGEAHLDMPSFRGQTEKAFRKFCHRPWFFRTWTIQEISLCKQAIIMCGQDTEEWSTVLAIFIASLRPFAGR